MPIGDAGGGKIARGSILRQLSWAQICIFIGAVAVVYLGEFLIRLFYAPAKMEKATGEKLERVERISNETNERTETRMKNASNCRVNVRHTCRTRIWGSWAKTVQLSFIRLKTAG